MDIVQLYQDFSVDFVTEGHKHARAGWVNVECPWCTGNPGYHLSYNIQGDFYLCWRCGWHPTSPTVSKLIHLAEKEVEKLLKRYGLRPSRIISKPQVKENIKEHKLPSNVHPLISNHIRYLQARNFDDILIPKIWTLSGTGPVSQLDGLNFKFRIIIPIIWNSQQVSFTSRDIIGNTDIRYLTCPANREIIQHKKILYGKQENWKSTGICVEGPTDVWRLGVHSFATFGIKYTNSQLRQITKAFKRVAIFFDNDPQADIQAQKLVGELKFRGVDAFQIPWRGGLLEAMKGADPGSIKQEDADYLVKQIIK